MRGFINIKQNNKGFASIDTPWLKYYEPNAFERATNIPNNVTVWDILEESLLKYEDIPALEYFKSKSIIDIYIIPMNTYKETLKIANELRKRGLKVELEMKYSKMKKCFEYANRENIPFVIVIGEDELKSNTIKVKAMFTGIEKKISLNNLIEIQYFVQNENYQ